MRLHIIGRGVVGTATGEGFRRFGHDIIYTDKGDDHGAVQADFHFICTPEEAVPEVVYPFSRPIDHPGIIVVRSSTRPGICALLAAEIRRPVLHNPEFLREATAQQDFLTANRVIIGYNRTYERDANPQGVLEALYRPFCTQIYLCHSTVSELVKLLTNNYLATLISFWNEAAPLCEALEVNSHEVARLVALDPRVSPYGAVMHGEPYGGRCLPKDVEQMLVLRRAIPTISSPVLLEAVNAINQRVGGS